MRRITLERERRGWTKWELCRRANVQPTILGMIECGRLVPYPRQLLRLAQALEWPGRPEELLEEVDEHAPAR